MCVWETRQNEFKLREKCKQSESAPLALKSTLCSPESSLTVCQTVSWPFAPQIGHGISNTVNTSLSLRFQQKKTWQNQDCRAMANRLHSYSVFFFLFFFCLFFFFKGAPLVLKTELCSLPQIFLTDCQAVFSSFSKAHKKRKEFKDSFFFFFCQAPFFLVPYSISKTVNIAWRLRFECTKGTSSGKTADSQLGAIFLFSIFWAVG